MTTRYEDRVLSVLAHSHGNQSEDLPLKLLSSGIEPGRASRRAKPPLSS
ncbi:hypothetical protein RUA4292_03832 [Ruegeria atlantica]|uniref:Uncharacterized protein n=1 Tax=Ruegeria atlantica TaxID=81569 RepID=A0A0N7LR25_9RHOB|nr:hypothetical protein RUA4292_03832 [Ruegeria atlantica]